MSDNEPYNPTPDEVARLIMLVFGTMADGNPFWCFVAVKPSHFEHVKQLGATKSLDLRTFEQDGYGEIVVSGEGVIPPDDVLKRVSAIFRVRVRDMFQDFDVDKVIQEEIDRVKQRFAEA